MRFSYLLFDLDGTLTDPKEGITKCVQYALHHFGIQEPDRENLMRFIGPPLFDSFRDFYGFEEKDAWAAVDKYRERFSVQGLYENKVYPGIPDLLAALKAAGKTVALATSKPEIFALRILDYFKLSSYFDCIVGAELDSRRNAKKEVIAEVIARLGLTDEEKPAMLMIGDRRQDITGAKQMGIASLGVRFGYAEPKELEDAGADYLVSTVEQLKTFLLQ